MSITKKQIIFVFIGLILLCNGCAGLFPGKPPGKGIVPKLPQGDPELTVVYPRIEAGDSVYVGSLKDSVFIYGNVSHPDGRLTIDSVEIPVHDNGAWLGWVKLPEAKLELSLFEEKGWLSSVTIEFLPASNVDEMVTKKVLFFEPIVDQIPSEPLDTLYSATLTVIDTLSRIRCGWPGTYYLFPPVGTKMRADGILRGERTFYRIPLGVGKIGFIEDVHVIADEGDTAPGLSVIYSIITEVDGRNTLIKIPLNEQTPFQVQQRNENQLVLTLFGVRSWTDLILQPFDSKVVDEIRWNQVDPSTYELTAWLKPGWFWGWDTSFDSSGNLIWTIKQAPEIARKPLKDLIVVLDPGHGAENHGALGPAGLTEKVATLDLAWNVKEKLEKAGAKVILTREADIDIPLHNRVKMANKWGADLLLSLHYNGIPQGWNPYSHHGSSVHYNHRHAKVLAEKILEGMLDELHWENNGLRYQDLAIPRNHVCPSVLIETAFLLHPVEEALAQTEEFQDRVANGIRKGLEQYLIEIRKRQEK
ncbi:N-acetylmuramoyl-L-alanine amidase [bacterium]|nr:N-acetylmuramoyl-L-alanine amidase [bacterium]